MLHVRPCMYVTLGVALSLNHMYTILTDCIHFMSVQYIQYNICDVIFYVHINYVYTIHIVYVYILCVYTYYHSYVYTNNIYNTSRPLYGGGSGVCVHFAYVYIVL